MDRLSKTTNPIIQLLNKIAVKRFSRREKIILIILGILFVSGINFLLIRWINQFKKESKVIETIIRPPSTDKAASPQKKPQAAKTAKPSAGKKKVFDIRDPFLSSKNPGKLKPVNVQKKAAVNLKVSGILWDEKIPSAIINSQVVKIGDIIFDKTVVDIDKDRVVLMEEGQLYILKLHKK